MHSYWELDVLFNFDILCFRRRQWHPTPVLLPGKSHGRRSLVGCSPWGREESDTTERLHFHFSLSCLGEGNGNPLQCSCLENPRDGGAWWAAVYAVAPSRPWLKRLSSSNKPLFQQNLPELVKDAFWKWFTVHVYCEVILGTLCCRWLLPYSLTIAVLFWHSSPTLLLLSCFSRVRPCATP